MEISIQFLVLVPIVIGLVEAVKRLGLNTRYAPALAILLGVVGALGVGPLSFAVALQGVVVGLTAAGLYASTKTTLEL